MKVSELIKQLKDYQYQHGDVVLFSEKDDGKSSWWSPIKLSIDYIKPWGQKTKMHIINLNSGY